MPDVGVEALGPAQGSTQTQARELWLLVAALVWRPHLPRHPEQISQRRAQLKRRAWAVKEEGPTGVQVNSTFVLSFGRDL